MKKFWFLLFIIFVGQTVRAEPLRIGAIIPLTGAVADYGVGIQRGIEIAEAADPTLRDRVVWEFEDVGYDPAQAVRAFHYFRTERKVDLIYTWGVSFCRALAPLSVQFRIPIVGQCLDAGPIGATKDFVRLQNSTIDYIAPLVDYMRSVGIKRIAVIAAEHPYIASIQAAFREAGGDQFSTVILEEHSMQTQDFRTTVAKIRVKQPDAVMLWLMPGQVSLFAKQFADASLHLPLLGTNLFESQSELRAAAGALDGALLVGNEIAPWYGAELNRRYGEVTQETFSGLAHDFAVAAGKLGKRNSDESAASWVAAAMPCGAEGLAAGCPEPRIAPTGETYFFFPLTFKQVAGDTLRSVNRIAAALAR